MYLIDSHCHLNFDGLKDRLPEVFANMEAQSVKQALAISVSKQSFAEVFDIAQANDHIYCTIGIHPDSQEAEEFTIAEMVEAAKHPKIVGIGETGLDYYWCKGDAPFLAPVPKRGKQNEPSYVRYTAEFLANLRGESLETLAQNTNDNFYRLFNKVPDGRLNNG